jgi:hypothetical protein
MSDTPSPFELAAAELRRLGITLARLPGEYRVNFRGGAEATAFCTDTLDDALALGKAMAAERTAAVPSGDRPTGHEAMSHKRRFV